MKKRTMKLTAMGLAVCITLFAIPGFLNAQPNHHRPDVFKWLQKPVTFLASLLDFVPVYSIGQPAEVPAGSDDGLSKVTGDLHRGRPSEGD
ncbi:MAG: hypothetical protein R6V02_03320 [Candidatus Aminicenantes bacterium]